MFTVYTYFIYMRVRVYACVLACTRSEDEKRLNENPSESRADLYKKRKKGEGEREREGQGEKKKKGKGKNNDSLEGSIFRIFSTKSFSIIGLEMHERILWHLFFFCFFFFYFFQKNSKGTNKATVGSLLNVWLLLVQQ